MIRPPMRPILLAALPALALSVLPARAGAEGILVFAASSLTNALNGVADAWTRRTGHPVVISYAGSSALARQIQEGAPADVFLSASGDWMDALEASGDLRTGTRRDILGNRLVLIAHGRSAEEVSIDENLDLAGLLGGGRLSVALIEAVPAGIYARDALENLGLWDQVAPLVVQSDNVRAALSFVARNEAPLGIVYATDAAAEDNVTVIGTFPEESHDPIVYPAAIPAQSESPDAQAFLDFLVSQEARSIWRGFGFSIVE
ncbi:molybdate ABC transporter substrate-binding protein [Plastorhodobacter daqingensis]|uniref:Molybdate ABC transporter substrate-binding protein n=1 Tax=Plastorhodobacter daqingensis TaxID=1387281 RepID=A0ABW2UIU4_9RHOB